MNITPSTETVGNVYDNYPATGDGEGFLTIPLAPKAT